MSCSVRYVSSLCSAVCLCVTICIFFNFNFLLLVFFLCYCNNDAHDARVLLFRIILLCVAARAHSTIAFLKIDLCNTYILIDILLGEKKNVRSNVTTPTTAPLLKCKFDKLFLHTIMAWINLF